MKELVLEEPDTDFEKTYGNDIPGMYGYAPELKESKYGTAERIFAFICMILGYFAIRSFNDAGLGASVTVVLMIAATAVYMNYKGALQRLPHYVYLTVVALFSSVFILSDDGFIKTLATLFIILALLFYPYFTHGSGRGGFIDDTFVFDMIKSVLIMPFSSIVSIFPAAFSVKRKKKSGFRAWHVAVGLAAAVIPALIVARLLCSADLGFEGVMRSALDFLSHGAFKEIVWFTVSTPIAMYMFGSLFSNAARKHKAVLTPDQHTRFKSAVSVVPQAIAFSAVTPLCILYVIFLSVQAQYCFGGFASNLPDGMTYAEYARSGFFELCAVAVINMAVIILLAAFTKKKEGGKASIPLKIYSIVLSCFTLLLIAVAMSKMIMYINAYGLTRLRIFTSWFMILLAFAFIFVIVKQVFAKFNYFGVLAAVFAVLFGILCFSDVDGRIAEYNVNAYISGKTENIDMLQLSKLSDSAIPYIIELTQPVEGRSDGQNRATIYKANEIISEYKNKETDNNNIIHFNYPRYRAKKAAGLF